MYGGHPGFIPSTIPGTFVPPAPYLQQMPQQFAPYSYDPICSNPTNASASMAAPMPMYNVPEHVPFRAHEIKATDKVPVCINLNTKKDGYDLTHEENNVGKVYAL